MEQLEQQICDIWSEFQPEIAFKCGNEDMAGKFFIPNEENIQQLLERISELKVATIDSVNHGVLNCLETMLQVEEPHNVLWNALWAYFGYLVKEGVNQEHMTALTRDIISALGTVYSRVSTKKWSMELKIITVNNYLALLGIIDSIQRENRELKPIFSELQDELKKYMKKFSVPEIKNGVFSEVYPLLEKKGGNIGRKEVYPDILKHIWGYLETPMEIESQALFWLNDERPKLKIITDKLAMIYNVDPNIESISSEMTKRNGVKEKALLELIKEIRGPLKRVVEKNIVQITPKYDTRLMETPAYLLNFISTAAMTPFDLFTDKPFNIFFVTTNKKQSPPTSISDLFLLIIHEEFGHCVHFSNSSTKFRAKPNVIELLYTNLALPISDGISFYREWEAWILLNNLISKPESDLDTAEKELINVIRLHNDPNLFLMEFEFTILRWRVIRFLRAIGDVRINMHKQSLTEFINWAAEYSGLSKKFIFDQIFLFQVRPGYAPCYSIVGNSIQILQTKAKERGRSEIGFNTFASSLGFPTRAVFEQKLKEF